MFKVGDIVRYQGENYVLVDIDNEYYEDGSSYPYGIIKVSFLVGLYQTTGDGGNNGEDYYWNNAEDNRLYLSAEDMRHAEIIKGGK